MLKINKTIIFSFVFSFFIFIPILTNAQIIETVIPGTTEGEGKHFEITNSAYLNITLDSSESIKLRMESIPKMITIMIESISSAQSAEIILSGLAPLTTYYKYQDDYHNLETFTTDENGDYTYPQDLSVPHFIFIQTQKSTKFIKDDASGGDCNLIGTWDATKKTCTLNADLNETIQIDSDNITLDGDGHEISGGNTGFGVYFQEKFGITIKNTTLKNFSKGISFRYSYQNILNNNSISNTYEGINGWYSANNTLSKNKFLSNNDGICLYYSDNNNLSDNIILNNNYDGVGFYNSSNNTFVGNTVSNNHYSGMGLYTSNTNTIIDNTILNNGSDGLSFYDSAENKVSGNNISNGGSDGIPLYNSYNNIFSKNTISNNFEGDGVPFYNSYNNIFTDNIISNNEGGVALYYSDNNKIYNNNFLDNSTQAVIYSSIGNIFNLDLPIAGNYWKNFDRPADGCNDVNNDHICDSPYIFSGGQDNLPWIKKDGWLEEKSLPTKAASLAKQVVNAPYLGDGETYGGKGWDPLQNLYVSSSEIFDGYNYWNNKLRKNAFGSGLDCSGLTQWAFNRSFDPSKSLLRNAIRYDGADGQYKNNSETIDEADLQRGDLMFFDGRPPAGHIDHVAMYVGDFVSGGETFNVVQATSPLAGIIPSKKDDLKTLPGFLALGSNSLRRVVLSPSIGGQVKAGSPIDLMVTDPDGFTITPTTAIQTDEEYLREIPGELYYAENVIGADGHPEDIVYWPKRKTGDYIIKVLPELGASPTETYSIEFTVGEQTITLAENIPINQIPNEGYGVTVEESGATSQFIPVSIDIKLGSYPNSINLGSNGVVPVAIFGSVTFDVHQINFSSITVANSPIKLKNNGQLMVSYEDINSDSFTDVVVHIITKNLQLKPTDTQANLEGKSINGTIIRGSDSIRIVSKN